MIRYVLDTKNLGFKLESSSDASKPWELVCFSYSDYVGDPISRRSISGFTLFVLGVLVCWQSKAQQSMMLSTVKLGI